MFDGIEYRGAAQMLADILTMRDHASKPLTEVSYCYLGDGRNNVANSLLVTGALLGMDVRICAPWSLQPSERVQEIAGKLAAESGALLTVTADVLAAVAGADFLCLVSRTLVRRDDPAFAHPSTFVGPVYSEEQARALAASEHWEIRQDGARWRRVVPSPEPAGLPDLPAIRTLLGTGAIVVCARGGGVPVVVRDGQARGVEAVVDKDLTASLLARELDADALLLLTDVAAVQDGYGTPAGPADPPGYARRTAEA